MALTVWTYHAFVFPKVDFKETASFQFQGVIQNRNIYISSQVMNMKRNDNMNNKK